uniref:protein-tyrosine-phosphatase n=1 Tax=Buteo japonicus TaxID=224669 RepID=A0A8B9Z167_9AVES
MGRDGRTDDERGGVPLRWAVCEPPSEGGPVEILPFLYLGSAYHASRKDMLDALGITALINVSANCPNHFEGHYQYKSIPVEDNHKADINSVKNDGGRVFVHCQAGISRSATICLAYLMRTNRVKLDEAFEFVKQRRSIISPNFILFIYFYIKTKYLSIFWYCNPVCVYMSALLVSQALT